MASCRNWGRLLGKVVALRTMGVWARTLEDFVERAKPRRRGSFRAGSMASDFPENDAWGALRCRLEMQAAPAVATSYYL